METQENQNAKEIELYKKRIQELELSLKKSALESSVTEKKHEM